jgi:hypothetical protein
MMPEPTDALIQAFWCWAEEALPALGDHFERLDPERFSARIHELHPDLGWELGPGLVRASQLVISPAGLSELLPLTRHIVSCAPDLPDWEFHPAKPPKRWDRVFDLGGPRVEIDRWRYALVAGDERFDVTLIAPELGGWSDSQRLQAMFLVLDAELGEARVIEWLGEVDLVEEAHWGDQPSGSIDGLSSHVQYLILDRDG